MMTVDEFIRILEDLPREVLDLPFGEDDARKPFDGHAFLRWLKIQPLGNLVDIRIIPGPRRH